MEAEQFYASVLHLELHGDPGGVSQKLNRFSGTPSNDHLTGGAASSSRILIRFLTHDFRAENSNVL
jgi:hypothetical protein